MEEIKCCLLGFPSTALDASTGVPTQECSSSSSPPPLFVVPSLSEGLRAQLHPSELNLLETVLPLGGAYKYLHDFATSSHGSRPHRLPDSRSLSTVRGSTPSGASSMPHTSLYASALRVGVSRVLACYVDAVKSPALSSASALSHLEAQFGGTMMQLAQLAHTASGIESAAIAASQAVTSRGPRRARSPSPSTVSSEPLSESSSVIAAVSVFLEQWDAFARHQGLPAAFRAYVGESIWLSVLFTTAHFVAHGVVLHGRKDFFLQPLSAAKPTTSSDADDMRRSGDYAVVEAYVPVGISFDLALTILAAGRARRMLVEEALSERQGPTYGLSSALRGQQRGNGGRDRPASAANLASLAVGAQDEVAEAVLHTVFYPALCVGGHLVEEELAARVETARSLWSKALWLKVKDPYGVLKTALPSAEKSPRSAQEGGAEQAGAHTAHSAPPPSTRLMASLTRLPTLLDHLSALQGGFLCQRGDVWRSFVSEVHTVIETGQSETRAAGPHRAGGGGGALAKAEKNALLHRRAEESFVAALAEAGLGEAPCYASFELRVSESCPAGERLLAAGAGAAAGRRGRTVEDIAMTVLERIQALHLHYDRPTSGLGLVVTDKALSYYQQLFAFQLTLRFALRALQETRQSFREALLTNQSPSAELRRAHHLLQTLLFLVSTIREYGDVDITAPAVYELERGMQACRSVEEAKQRHDRFIWSLAEGYFLTPGHEAVRRACQEACRCAMTLHLICSRYGVVYWAVEGVNEVPPEVSAVLTALETRLHQDIVAVCLGHLGVASRPAERALWVRLDFSRFFSQGLRAEAADSPRSTKNFSSSSTAASARGQYGGVPAPIQQPAGPRRSSVGGGTVAVRSSSATNATRRGSSASSSSALPLRGARPSLASARPTLALNEEASASVQDGCVRSQQQGEAQVRTLSRSGQRTASSVSSSVAAELLPALPSSQPSRTPPAPHTTPATTATANTNVVFSVPAVRSFATAAYPGGVAPPGAAGTSPSSSSSTTTRSSAHIAAAIAARQAAVAATGTAATTLSTRTGGGVGGGATAIGDASRDSSVRDTTAVAAIAASAAARASRPRAHASNSAAPLSARAAHVDVQPRGTLTETNPATQPRKG